MPLVTYFKSPDGDDLPIAAAELVTVAVPAAGSAAMANWSDAADPGKYTRFLDLAAPADSAILPSDQSLITDHGLTITHDAQGEQWVLQLDSLPAEACTLTLIFIHCENGGQPLVLPLGGSSAQNIMTFDSVDEMNATEAPDGTIALVPSEGGVYKVRIPAAGSTELYGWTAAASGYELMIPDVAWMKEDLVLELKSENAALITEHNLTLYPDNGFLDFSIDSLPEQESVLYIVVPTIADGGELNG